MKKIFKLLSLTVLSFVLTGCNIALLLPKTEEKAELKLNLTEVTLKNAVVSKTSFNLEAELVNYESEIYWFTDSTSVVSLSAKSGNKISVIVLKNGSANISAVTSDGKFNALCKVEVELGTFSCHEISDLTITDKTCDSITLDWIPSSDAAQVKVECYQNTTLISTTYMSNSEGTGKVTGLFQNTDYKFIAYGCMNGNTANESLSEKKCSATGKTEIDTEAPESVTNLKAVNVTDHSITFTWRNPSDLDYAYVTISTADKDCTNSLIPSVKLDAAKKQYTFENLNGDYEYTFTFATEDKFGNIQGDANNADSEPAYISVLTKEDATSPAAPSDIFVTVGESSMLITWNEDAASVYSDFAKVNIQINEEVPVSVNPGVRKLVTSYSSGTDYSISLWTADYASNESEKVTVEISNSAISSSYSSFTAEAKYTGQIKASLVTESGDASFVICAVNKNNASDFNYSSVLKGNKGEKLSAVFNGLAEENEYAVYVYPSVEIENAKILYETGDSPVNVNVKKVVWEIIQPWGSQTMVPQISDSNSYANIIITSSPENYKYPYWIVMPAINGDEDAFSLLACDSSLNPSELYLYFGSNGSGGVNYNSGNNSWGYSTSSHTYMSWSATLEVIDTDKDFACFTSCSDIAYSKDTVSGFTSWFNLKLFGTSDVYLTSNNYNVSADKGLTSDKAFDSSFAYKEK